MFSKFIKRYCHLPPWVNNATLYFVTQTTPLSIFLKNRAPHMTSGLSFPISMSGIKLSFLKNEAEKIYNPIPDIPSSFWLSKIFMTLPARSFYRKKMCTEIFDVAHRDLCATQPFHNFFANTCICIRCGTHAHRFHERFCIEND